MSSCSLFLDYLHCEEKYWDDVDEENEDDDVEVNDVDDDFDQLFVLFCKEEKEHFNESDLSDNMLLMMERKEGLDWMIRVNDYHNFGVVTLVLSVNYFDKMMIKFGYQNDRPWMTQLVAVACVSLASKIEETHAPLLSHLLVDNKYTFDTKTIQRMELLVLSTFEWKMYAITPLSFLECLIARLKLKDQLHWEILHTCQTLLLYAIVDPRYLCYAPSVLAVATMRLVLEEHGLWRTLEKHMLYLMNTFKLDKEKIEKCQKLIKEFSSKDKKKTQKRERLNSAESPKYVLDAIFCESSKDSIMISSSSESALKRSRITNSFGSLNEQ